jgi:hypothetical protein
VFDKKGSVLISAYIMLLALLAFSGIFFSRSVTDKKLLDMDCENTEAFYLAEAGVDHAIKLMSASGAFSSYSGTSPTSFGRGEYEVTNVANVTGSTTKRRFVAHGYVPDESAPRAERTLEVIVQQSTPANFFDNALYSANNIDINGTSYTVTGKALYANATTGALDDICDGGVCGASPTVTRDATISPLAQFDFAALRLIAASQVNANTINNNNIYTAADISASNKFPQDFYYSPGVPNVVYVEGDITFKNQNTTDKTAGGFFIVVGTDPTVSIDTTLSGNILVNGCIYTTGTFANSGGGSNSDVNGGIWSGEDIDLSGSVDITYNSEYMMAAKTLTLTMAAVQIFSWRECTTEDCAS